MMPDLSEVIYELKQYIEQLEFNLANEMDANHRLHELNIDLKDRLQFYRDHNKVMRLNVDKDKYERLLAAKDAKIRQLVGQLGEKF